MTQMRDNTGFLTGNSSVLSTWTCFLSKASGLASRFFYFTTQHQVTFHFNLHCSWGRQVGTPCKFLMWHIEAIPYNCLNYHMEIKPVFILSGKAEPDFALPAALSRVSQKSLLWLTKAVESQPLKTETKKLFKHIENFSFQAAGTSPNKCICIIAKGMPQLQNN